MEYIYKFFFIFMFISKFNLFYNLAVKLDEHSIHNHLSTEELQFIFKTKNRSEIPEHDIVSIYHTFSNGIIRSKKHSVQLNAFGKNLKLYLQPRERVIAGQNMPIWIATYKNSTPYNIHYTPLSYKKRLQIFEDINNLAVLSVTMNYYGKPMLDGILGNDLRISPLPNTIIDGIMSNKNNKITKILSNFTKINDVTQTFHHVVYKIKNIQRKNKLVPKQGKGFKVFNKYKKEIRKKRETENNNKIYYNYPGTYLYNENVYEIGGKLPPVNRTIAYPEILIVVDYYEYLIIGPKYEDVVKYVLTYWYAVDLRFRQFKNPDIRLNIAGIIISVDAEAIYYINEGIINIKNKLVDINKVLDMKGQYFEKQKMFILEKDYDIVATMTNLRLCSYSEYDENYCNPSTLGYSYEAGACIRVEDDEKSFVESITLLEDNGGFSGIIPTAHEIGHLLGARHDPFNDPCYNGYIMHSQYLMTNNNFVWSECSIRDISIYLRSPRSECLFNKPKVTQQYSLILPGQLYSLEEQCKIAFNSTPCYYDDRVCTYLECLVPNSDGQCYVKSSAAEGSKCGINKICINGNCIPLNMVQFKNVYIN